MKSLLTAVSIGICFTLVGCNDSTTGGPGATPETDERSFLRLPEETFSLDTPMMAARLSPGESRALTIGINRGKNFQEDVSLMLDNLPDGVVADPTSAVIANGESEAEFVLQAKEDAVPGDFTVTVTGRPTEGADAVAHVKILVEEPSPEVRVEEVTYPEQAQRQEYITTMDQQLEEFKASYHELKGQAAKAEGEAKEALDQQTEALNEKLNAAAAKLDELKLAAAEQWTHLKEGVDRAFDDLKSTPR
jgi:hypothetical protein